MGLRRKQHERSSRRNQTQIVEFDEFEAKLQEFKKQYDDVVYDLTVPEQEKQARSDRFAIGKIISALDNAHKIGKAPWKEKCDLYDSARKRIKDGLLTVQGKIKNQIDKHEREIEEHAEMLQAKVDGILSLLDFLEFANLAQGLYWIEIDERITLLEDMGIDDSYEDRKADATLAKVETIQSLKELQAKEKKQQEDQEELSRLRQEKEERDRADREEKIRQEAEAKAKREAEEKAEREKQEAAAEAQRKIDDAQQKQEEAEIAARRAEEEKKLAAKTAAREEREKIEREQKEAEEKAKAERQKKEAKKAKQAHRSKIHKQAIESLVAAVFELDDEHATPIIEAIKEGKIKHVSINY